MWPLYPGSAFTGWRFCTFSYVPDFMAKTQNPYVLDPRFGEFMVPSLVGLLGGARDELLLFPVRTLKRYLFRQSSTIPTSPTCSS